MEQLGGFFCGMLKRSVSSMLPCDIPWYDTSHLIFFSAVYGVLAIIGIGTLAAVILTLMRMRKNGQGEQH